MRIALTIVVPAEMTAEDCEAFLKSPDKFMDKRGGEVEFKIAEGTIVATGKPAYLEFIARVPKSLTHSWRGPEPSLLEDPGRATGAE